MIRHLRRRFIRIATIAVGLVLTLLCLAVNVSNYVSVQSEMNHLLRTIADNRGIIPNEPPDTGKPGARPNNGQFTKETPFSTRYFVLRYTDAGVLMDADLRKIASVTEQNVNIYLSAAQAHGTGFGYKDGYKFYVVDHGNGNYMAIFLDMHQQQRSFLSLAILSVCATILCIAVVYIIIVLYSRRAIEPMVDAARKQKQFITDASHELKTPITVIATSLKVLEMETGKQKWIDKAQVQTEKLTQLVSMLVTLSKMDEDDSLLHMEPFPIGEIVNDTADSFRDYAAAQAHHLMTDIQLPLEYVGDSSAIRQLVSILLDNAIKYATPNTPVFLSLRRNKRNILLTVENKCERFLPEDINKIFDRFYRSDQTRNTQGFGIGLSIAKSIVQGHGGTIHASLRADTTICFTAELRCPNNK